MKIVHVATSFMTGGAEVLAIDLMNEQLRLGHAVTLLILADIIDETLLKKLSSSIDVVYLHRPPSSKSLYYVFKSLWLMFTIRPDVIHYHLAPNRLLFLYPCRHIVTVHGMMRFKDRKNVLAFKLSHHIVAISHSVCDCIKSLYSLKKVEVIYNGINLSAIKKKEYLECPPKSLRIVNLARLDMADKAQDILIRAVKLLESVNPDVIEHVDLIGDGKSREVLQSLVVELGLDHKVRFLGMLEREYIYEHLCEYDLMIHPSRSEGFGLAVAEGMAARLPVIVSDCPALREIIQGGTLGSLFKTDSPESCADTLLNVLKNWAEVYKKVYLAEEYATNKYSIQGMTRSYIELYQK